MNFNKRTLAAYFTFFIGFSYPLKSICCLNGLRIASLPALQKSIDNTSTVSNQNELDYFVKGNVGYDFGKFTCEVDKDLSFELYTNTEEAKKIIYDSDNEADGFTNRKRGRTKAPQIYNYSRQDKKRSSSYSEVKNYVSNDEKEYLGYLENQELLLKKLSIDSKLIAEANEEGYKGSTVIFCVMLMDKNNHLKRFAFHNGESVMKPSMREKAEELGYDVIKAEQSHAEGQFLQFLLHRSNYPKNSSNARYYTHIVGMGCSRSHCAECDTLLSLLLGNNYHEVTSSVDHTKNNNKR